MTMRVCAVLYALLLLLSWTLSKTHVGYPQRSMEINPDIDASWYTERGIRPVGRFGRRMNGRIHSREHHPFPLKNGCIRLGPNPQVIACS
uniref:Prolactin releasing hormone n=1 Tax=Salmo trutta TaxID=8032 RepID=A0A673ZMC6_SALTR